MLAVGWQPCGRPGGRMCGRPGSTWFAHGTVRPASWPGDLLTFFGVSFMAMFKVAGSCGYPFKRHVNILKRHLNSQPYRQELPMRRRADYDVRRRKRF